MENVLAECGQDIDAAIRRLTDLKLSAEQGAAGEQQAAAQQDTGAVADGRQQVQAQQTAAAAAAAAASQPVPQTAEQWVDALVQEMAAAKDMGDARSRAGKLLQAFEQFVTARSKGEVRTWHTFTFWMGACLCMASALAAHWRAVLGISCCSERAVCHSNQLS